jgi:hypothetical protein
MLENYIKDENGTIKQINVKTIEYSKDYVINSYDRYGELSNYISYLRYGYLIATIKKIPDSILDFGYGNGSFLNVCKKTIQNCYGYDVGEYDVPDGCKRIDNIFEKHFDVISFFDSLEHVNDTYFLDKLNCNHIIISIPECHYFSDEWFYNWKHRRENEHIWHFNQYSLEKFMGSQGFKAINMSNIEDIIRIPYDVNVPNIMTGVFKRK